MIPSQWPTSKVTYNTSAHQYAGIMGRSLSLDHQVTFLVDQRQAWRNMDGMRHLNHGHQHALYTTSLPSFCR